MRLVSKSCLGDTQPDNFPQNPQNRMMWWNGKWKLCGDFIEIKCKFLKIIPFYLQFRIEFIGRDCCALVRRGSEELTLICSVSIP